MTRSERTIRVIICTILGLAASALIFFFINRETGTTAEMWIERLFSFEYPDAWILLAIMGVVPVACGVMVGLWGEGIGSILKLPFLAIALSVSLLFLTALIYVFVRAIQTGDIWSYVAMAVFIAAGIAASRPVIRVITWVFVG